MEQRLQKFLANAGIASRRKCEELIEQGKITVNGKVVTEQGIKINPEKDKVTYNGQTVENISQDFVYILLNKPIGVVTTAKDQFGRPTVLDIIRPNQCRGRVPPLPTTPTNCSGWSFRYVHLWSTDFNKRW